MSVEKQPRSVFPPTPPPGRGRAERRSAPRLEDTPPLFVTGIRATVHDVSRAGICLNVAEPVAPGLRVRLVLKDALDFVELAMTAEAVWATAHQAGFRWVDMTPDQDAWLREHFQSWLATCLGASRR